MLLAILIAISVCILVVWLVKKQAERTGLIQHANDRSSHTDPTPTGGGLGIIAGCLAGVAVTVTTASDGHLADFFPILLALCLATLVGALGFLDDLKPLSARLRLSIQFALIAILAGVNLMPNPSFVSQPIFVSGILALAIIIAGVWWLNLFNFLDGIDGYAASQALFMLVGAVALASISGAAIAGTPLLFLMICAGTTTIGFLLFNWPPAKIFMGDTGSLFLGFLLFAIAIFSVQSGWITLIQWLVLASIFVVDATATLLRRLLRGVNVFNAHRSHAYQHLSRRWNGHRPVMLALTAANILIILPLAWAAGHWPEMAPLISIIVLVTLAVLAIRIGAGRD